MSTGAASGSAAPIASDCIGCLTGHDIGLPSPRVAYPHPRCPEHGEEPCVHSSVPYCFNCHKSAEEVGEYDALAADADMSVAEFVRREEGTYNPATNRFACTPCYIRIGQPSSPRGWVAP